jgi:hypothetical protein
MKSVIGNLGMLIAMFISAVTWKSVFWFIVHGIFGWWYVLYFIAAHNDLVPAIFETIKGWF